MLPDLTLFLDENLHNCKPILQVLMDARMPCERHRDHFTPGTPDEIWIPLVGLRGWALLTSDSHIRTRHLERAAIQEYGVAMFCFTGKVAGAAIMASALARAIPHMRRLVETQLPPFIATITGTGEVSVREIF